VNIRFISSLTPEDEDRIAPAVITAVSAFLDQLPIAYTLRIETSGNAVHQHAHTNVEEDEPPLQPRKLPASLSSVLRARSPLP
jgi:hypothetical protein